MKLLFLLAVKSEPAEEQNPEAESAGQETEEKATTEVKEEPKDEDEKEDLTRAVEADKSVVTATEPTQAPSGRMPLLRRPSAAAGLAQQR